MRLRGRLRRIDTAAVFVLADVAHADITLRQDARKRVARGRRPVALAVTTRVQSGASMPRSRTRAVTSMPGQMRTRASKVSPSITRSTCAGWPVRRLLDADTAGLAMGAGARPAPAGAIRAPALKPAAKAAAAGSSAPPCRRPANDLSSMNKVLGI